MIIRRLVPGDAPRRLAGAYESNSKEADVKPMDNLSLQDPLFATYVIAATLMILKAVSMSWLTVVRMMQVKGGFRSPEDLRKTPLNPEPNPKQLEPNERVERVRRIQMNDLENLPFFLVAGFLYILTEPSLLLARVTPLRICGVAAAALRRLFHWTDPRNARHLLERGLVHPLLHDRPDIARRVRLLM